MVGILNAYDHFAIPAISPLVWNVVIIVGLVALKPLFHGPNQVYAYAIGVARSARSSSSRCASRCCERVGFHLHISLPLARPAHPPGAAC